MASNSFLTTEEDVPGAECVQPSIVEHTRSGWPGTLTQHHSNLLHIMTLGIEVFTEISPFFRQ